MCPLAQKQTLTLLLHGFNCCLSVGKPLGTNINFESALKLLKMLESPWIIFMAYWRKLSWERTIQVTENSVEETDYFWYFRLSYWLLFFLNEPLPHNPLSSCLLLNLVTLISVWICIVQYGGYFIPVTVNTSSSL